jgi:hypothetical protein
MKAGERSPSKSLQRLPSSALPAQLEQLAGVVVGGQHFAVQAQRQQPLPGTGQVLRAAVESQHQVLGVAQPEQAAFDVAGGEHQRGEAVLGWAMTPSRVTSSTPITSPRRTQRYRGAGKRAEAVEVMLAAVDQGGLAFDHGRADGVGAAQRLAPATAGVQVAQALALQRVLLAFDGQHVGLGVAEDDDAAWPWRRTR